MKKIGIIINANAKKIRKMRKDPGEIYQLIGGDLVDVRLTRSLSELDSVLADFRKTEIDYLAIAGGDGSLHHGLTHALNEYGAEKLPPIIILKGGTMDNVSRSLNLPGKGPDILKKMVRSLSINKNIKIEKRSTMEIEESYCFLFGAGFVTNFLNEVYCGTEKGLTRNIQVIGKSVKQIITDPVNGSLFQGFKGKVFGDLQLLDVPVVTAILAGTVEHIGMGFSPLNRALEKDDLFHGIISGISSRMFLKNLWKMKNGIRINLENHFDLVLRELQIESEEQFIYTMDGDLFTAERELTVKAGPQIKLVSL